MRGRRPLDWVIWRQAPPCKRPQGKTLIHGLPDCANRQAPGSRINRNLGSCTRTATNNALAQVKGSGP